MESNTLPGDDSKTTMSNHTSTNNCNETASHRSLLQGYNNDDVLSCSSSIMNSDDDDSDDDDNDDDGMDESSILITHMEGGKFHVRLDKEQQQQQQQQQSLPASRALNALDPDAPNTSLTKICMEDESKRSIAATVISYKDENINDVDMPYHMRRHRWDQLQQQQQRKRSCYTNSDADTHSIITDDDDNDEDNEDIVGWNSDSEDAGEYSIDWDMEKEKAIRKSIMYAIGGGTGVGYVMAKVTLLVNLIKRLLGLGGSSSSDNGVAECLVGEDPVDPTALFKAMVDEMSIEAAHNATSAMATGSTAATSSSTTTTMAGTLVGTVSSSTSGATTGTTLTMLMVATTVAMLSVMQEDNTVLPMPSISNNDTQQLPTICGHIDDSFNPHEIKQGHVRFGLKLFQADLVIHKQEILKQLFHEVYLNITGGCDGDYERLLLNVGISNSELNGISIPDDSNNETSLFNNSSNNLLVEGGNSSSVWTVYTEWEALISCNGCLDHEPLFTSSMRQRLLYDDVATSIASSSTTTTTGAFDVPNLTTLTPEDIYAPMSNTTIYNNNTLFMQFVKSYAAEVKRTLDLQMNIFYGAVLTPQGELIEEVNLEEGSTPALSVVSAVKPTVVAQERQETPRPPVTITASIIPHVSSSRSGSKSRKSKSSSSSSSSSKSKSKSKSKSQSKSSTSKSKSREKSSSNISNSKKSSSSKSRLSMTNKSKRRHRL